jgi:hypothetical protein
MEMAVRKSQGMRTRNQPRQKPYSNSKFKSSRETRDCYNCSRPRYFARDCKTLEYFVKMFQELQCLKSRQRETHTLDVLSLNNVDPENFMMSMDKSKAYSDVSMLDSATTHTIL